MWFVNRMERGLISSGIIGWVSEGSLDKYQVCFGVLVGNSCTLGTLIEAAT